MSDTRFDRDLRTVLRDMGPAEAPDALRRSVADVARTKPAPRRRFVGSRSLIAIAGLAAAVVVGAVGIAALVGGHPSEIVGTGGTPSPVATPPPTAAPVAGTSIEYQVLSAGGIAPTGSDLVTIRAIVGDRLGALAVVTVFDRGTGTDRITVTVPSARE